MPRTAVLTVPAIAVLTAAGCAASAGPPRVIAMDDIRVGPSRQAIFIGDYERALVSIAAVTERDLHLPRLRASLHFFPNRDALSAALEAEGAPPDVARDAAAVMMAIGGPGSVYINEAAFADLNWNSRIAVLAHELTHTIQYEFAGGRRGTSDQWLREGFAEWVQAHVLDALGVMRRDDIQARSVRWVRDMHARRDLPPLAKLATFPDWVAVHNGRARDSLYPYAFVATDFLVRRHGVEAVTTYFTLFAESDDRFANFATAFGEEWSAFDAALEEYFSRLIGT
ncbi:MAG: hypothetical protein HYU37_20620 [Acidobacteria bacterium]|nr:hypothetical protein [Acidobacteriota bacterium]